MEDVVPSFGTNGDAAGAGGLAGLVSGNVLPNGGAHYVPQNVVGLTLPNGSSGLAGAPAVEDELINCASVEKVQEVSEQIAEFLVNFGADDQLSILAPFLMQANCGDGGGSPRDWPGSEATVSRGIGGHEFSGEDAVGAEPPLPAAGADVEPHIDEAQRFIWNYLAVFSQCERDIILEQWRSGVGSAHHCGDTASTASATESHSRSVTPICVTPPISVTPTGSVTPTAVTPREFLSARREVNETYHHHSPMQQPERP